MQRPPEKHSAREERHVLEPAHYFTRARGIQHRRYAPESERSHSRDPGEVVKMFPPAKPILRRTYYQQIGQDQTEQDLFSSLRRQQVLTREKIQRTTHQDRQEHIADNERSEAT